jgi:hypothetical protein
VPGTYTGDGDTSVSFANVSDDGAYVTITDLVTNTATVALDDWRVHAVPGVGFNETRHGDAEAWNDIWF